MDRLEWQQAVRDSSLREDSRLDAALRADQQYLDAFARQALQSLRQVEGRVEVPACSTASDDRTVAHVITPASCRR